MSKNHLYIEGGGQSGQSKELKSRCREGFHKLLERSGFTGRIPRITACGSRNDAFEDFKTAHQQSEGYIVLLVDSEDPVSDVEKPWNHLKARDGWSCPKKVEDRQIFLMATCMETWIVADRTTLEKIYRSDCLQTSTLPALSSLEKKGRHQVQDALENATKGCANSYKKGKRSFEALGELDPTTLKKVLPSFARMVRILNAELPPKTT